MTSKARRIRAAAALLVLTPVIACAQPGSANMVRIAEGVLFEVPVGWFWRGLDLARVELVQRAGAAENPDTITIAVNADEPWNRAWARIHREERWRLPHGAEASFRTGEPWERHPAFRGVATVGQRRVYVTATRGAPFAAAEQAFRQIAGSLREVPRTREVFHAQMGFSMAHLSDDKTWASGAYSGGEDLRFYCYSSVCKTSRLSLFAYPSKTRFADIGEALADITQHFAREGVKIGGALRLSFPGGEAAWTEQPGTKHPLLGAVQREGRYFFVRVGEDEAGTNLERLKPGFLTILQTIRPRDPRN